MEPCTVWASTYSADNHMVYDGISRPGTRIVSFAPILKHDVFPLPGILERLTKIGEDALRAAGGDRVCSVFADSIPMRRPSSDSCRFVRWCCRAKAKSCAWKM